MGDGGVHGWADDLEAVSVDVTDGVAWVTLQRPDAANARNQRMRSDLLAVWAGVSASPDVRCVVLTGAGDRFFCAGMDLRESGREESLLQRRSRLQEGRDIEVLARLPRPTVALINGYALGGGLEMALACDLRIMAEDAEVGMPELAHGLIPGGGATARLPRLVGPGVAAEMIFTGRRLAGSEALAVGLVSRCVPRADLRGSGAELAATIASKPLQALSLAKESLLRAADLPVAAGVEQELDKMLMLLDQGGGAG